MRLYSEKKRRNHGRAYFSKSGQLLNDCNWANPLFVVDDIHVMAAANDMLQREVLDDDAIPFGQRGPPY
jgi:hypothetical protein